MELAQIEKLTEGTKVKCRLNGSVITKSWFTGHISRRAHLTSRQGLQLYIDRDDISGDKWTITVREINKHLIKLLDFEWNEEEN